MGTKKNFIPYDRFKIIILFLLLVILAIMVYARDPEFQPDQTVPELTFSTLANQLPTTVKADKELPAILSVHRDLFLNVDEIGLVD